MSAPSAWSKSGDSLAAGCGAVVKVWAGTEPGAEVKLFEGTPVFCLSFSPNNKVLAVGGDKGSVSLYSATPAPGSGERSVGTIPPLPEAGLEAVAALAFLPDTSLVTGGRHGGVHLWALRQHEVGAGGSGAHSRQQSGQLLLTRKHGRRCCCSRRCSRPCARSQG